MVDRPNDKEALDYHIQDLDSFWFLELNVTGKTRPLERFAKKPAHCLKCGYNLIEVDGSDKVICMNRNCKEPQK